MPQTILPLALKGGKLSIRNAHTHNYVYMLLPLALYANAYAT